MLAPQWQTNTPTLASSCGDVPLLRVDPLPRQLAAAGLQQLAASALAPLAGHHRLRDVHRPLEGAADEDARAGGLDRVGIGLVLQNPCAFEFDAEQSSPGVRASAGGRQTDAEHHQVELLLLDALGRWRSGW